ncbi:hypothetical protein QBC46DRAFT_323495 [Diplogelasinospora grovesii]|uniref:Calcium uniporter protein n=1 Tax=Diplogelasinospora grovesii TaxID=303347 RepID=A0AAN6N031_9PEZI|nr:hypothetical protein QBC46DRAFT_323495 [Diplogelasinospora grovesii]
MNHVFRRLPSQLTRCGLRGSTYRSVEVRQWSHSVYDTGAAAVSSRAFSISRSCRKDEWEAKARKLSQKGLDEHEQEVKVRQHQVKRPWHRQNADKPPVDEKRKEVEPITKGKLLTTPTRLLKLVLPLPITVEKDKTNNSNDYGRAISTNDDIQPLALLIHPQQPLSYVERLIQAEVPPVIENGKEKIPNVYFRAEDTDDSNNKPTSRSEAKERDEEDMDTAGLGASPKMVASYSGLGHEGPKRHHSDKNWVRWSSSTEMGDFIRDAARGREFAIEIEGYNIEMRVNVPSFNDRTYYMRLRLRKMSREIDDLAKIKHECDLLAHRSAHRLAKGGFALLTGWWGVVYYVTFHTDFGWDLVEPVTYLAGLTTIMGGYLWFLYISRDLSYKAAMNVTVSKRQNALYEARGFDLHKWEQLVQEANALSREIKVVAVEYDVDWDEAKDVGEEVKEVLDKERHKQGGRSPEEDKEQDEDFLREEMGKKEDDKKGKENS